MFQMLHPGKTQPSWYCGTCPKCGCQFACTEEHVAHRGRSSMEDRDHGVARCPTENCTYTVPVSQCDPPRN